MLELVGRRWPSIALPGTDGRQWSLDCLDVPAVVYAYPRTGRPGDPPLTHEWDSIPGAVGCTAESCAFRDYDAAIAALGVRIFGLSTQDTSHQTEMVTRLALPFPVLSDADLAVAGALGLATFEVAGVTLIRRTTLFVTAGRIAHVWYPVPDPEQHPGQVYAWLLDHVPA